jgi:hypothetical protein
MSRVPPKPPKPDDREAAPRYKSKKVKHAQPVTGETSVKKVLESLNGLIDAPPTYDHFAEFIAETNAEKNDRGAAILLATNVENALQAALLQMFRDKPKRSQILFGGIKAPLGSFSSKIDVAYYLDVIGDEAKQNLDIIRTVRNAFAHAKIPIKFETEQVKRACLRLRIPKLLPPHTIREPPRNLDARRTFQTVCNDTVHNLVVFASGGLKAIDAKKFAIQLPDSFEVLAKRRALP